MYVLLSYLGNVDKVYFLARAYCETNAVFAFFLYFISIRSQGSLVFISARLYAILNPADAPYITYDMPQLDMVLPPLEIAF